MATHAAPVRPRLRAASLTVLSWVLGLAGCASDGSLAPVSDWVKRAGKADSLAGAVVVVAAAVATTQPATQPGNTSSDIWDDPVFKKQFVAGYGINSEIEPRVTPEEVEVLETLRPLMADNLPKAKATLLKELKPESSAILDFTLGSINFQQGNMPEALDAYLKAVKKFPSFRRAWRNLGLVYTRQANYDEAIAAFARMIELGGGDGFSYGLLGFAYTCKEDYQAAEVAYRNALLLQPKNTEWRLGLTRCVFKQEKFEDAASLLNVLIERFPDKPEFWMLQAHAYVGMKQPQKAAENLEALERMGKSTADGMYMLGDIYLTDDLADMAARAYVRAIDLDANQPQPATRPVGAPDPLARPMNTAEVLAKRGALSQANRVAKHIGEVWGKKMAETSRRKLLKLEARLSMAEGAGTAETVRVLEEIVKLDPLDGEALLLLGQNWAKEGKQEQAIFYYERAEGIESYEQTAKLRHAQVLVGMKRYIDALPLLRRVQEIKPREDVARYLEQVERAAKLEQAERGVKGR